MKSFDVLQTELAAGTTTCVKIPREYLGTIEQKNHLNALLAVFPDKAIEQAKSVDKKLRDGNAGALAGMVVTIKDLICVKDERVTCGSKILENFVSLYDATVVRRLRHADAVIIGKNNMESLQWVLPRRIRRMAA